MKPYCSIQRLTSLIVILLCIFLLISCGDEDTDNSTTKEDAEDAPLGLSGGTYRNQKYLFKISNLPVDEWSIFLADNPEQKEAINFMLHGDKKYVPDTSVKSNLADHLILITPGKSVSADDLRQMATDLVSGQKAAHWILMTIEEQTVTKAKSSESLAKMYMNDDARKAYKFDETEEIRTKDGFSGHRIDGVYREDDNTKIGFAFFMRSSTNTSRVYRINYFGKKELEKTAKIRQVFDQIVASLEFNIL